MNTHTEQQTGEGDAPRDRSLEKLEGSPEEIALALHNDAGARGGTVQPRGKTLKQHIADMDAMLEPIAPCKDAAGSAHTPKPDARIPDDEWSEWGDSPWTAELVAERDMLREELESVRMVATHERGKLIKQLDELLAACKWALGSRLFSIDFEQNRTPGTEQTDLRDALLAAIKHAEAGQ
jgi:hypothetical protein